MEITIMSNIGESPSVLNIIDITRYITLSRVLRITALLVCFTRKWRKKLWYLVIPSLPKKYWKPEISY